MKQYPRFICTKIQPYIFPMLGSHFLQATGIDKPDYYGTRTKPYPDQQKEFGGTRELQSILATREKIPWEIASASFASVINVILTYNVMCDVNATV